MSSVRALGPLLAAVAMASGCILAANDDPSKLGTTCSFLGSDTPCGKCIAANCTDPLDKCCGGKACAGQLGHLDNCAGGLLPQPSECQALASGAPELYSCIAASCSGTANACNLGSSVDAGGDAYEGASSGSYCSMFASDSSCSCISSTAPNTVPCSTSTVPSPSLCCADADYPGTSSSSCSCKPFRCMIDMSGYASCGLGLGGSDTSASAGTGICCADVSASLCYCDPNGADCASGSPVSECSIATVGCASPMVNLGGCSL
jgi:hypothetical protein